MISSLTWVPAGGMARKPKKYKLTAEDYALMQQMADEDEGVGERGSALRAALKGRSLTGDEDGGISDDDSDSDAEDGLAPSALRAMAGLVDSSNAMGPGAGPGHDGIGDDDDNSSEEDDYLLRESDAVLLAAKSMEDYSALEVHVYNHEDGNFYVHHDVAMPTFPLCVEWLNFSTAAGVDGTTHNTPGSFAAMGTFHPGIEIYDLDVLEALEPDVTLGGPVNGSGSGGAGSGRRPTGPLKEGSHTAAVMALSWNRGFRNLLASGSADGTAKLWDLATQQCRLTFEHHKDKVQSVEWNPAEQNILATGSFDRTVAVVDARNPRHGSKFALPADIEDLQWNPHAPFQFVAGCEDGTLLSHDLRKGRDALFRIQAHGKAVSSLSFSQYVPGLLATASTDHAVKIWDLQSPAAAATGNANPNLVVSKNMNVGPLFSVRFFPGQPFLLATAGEEGMVAIWESSEDNHVSRCFGTSRQLESPPVFAAKTSGGAQEAAQSDSSAAAGPGFSAGTQNLTGGGGPKPKSKKGKKGRKKKK